MSVARPFVPCTSQPELWDHLFVFVSPLSFTKEGLFRS